VDGVVLQGQASSAQQEPQHPAPRSPLETAVLDTSTREELMHVVLEQHSQPLQPAELVLVCHHLAKVCTATGRTTFTATKQVQVGHRWL
jgi:hypothetical protein